MDISKWTIAWKYLFGGVDSVVTYVLGVLNKAIASITPGNKTKVLAALNTAKRVLAVLKALTWLCPTKWQTAYAETVAAVETVVTALEDLEITVEELDRVRKAFVAAVAAWNDGDDETCVDCTDTEG